MLTETPSTVALTELGTPLTTGTYEGQMRLLYNDRGWRDDDELGQGWNHKVYPLHKIIPERVGKLAIPIIV